MSSLRFKAVEEAHKKKAIVVEAPSALPSEYFGCNVFNRSTMSQYLSKEALMAYQCSGQRSTFGQGVADEVAAGINVGQSKRCNTLYTLVSAIDRRNC